MLNVLFCFLYLTFYNIIFPLALKVEKKAGESIDYNKLRVKQLKEILSERGEKCTGCTEKADYVKRCIETEGGDL